MKRIDMLLQEIGLSRKNLRYRFTYKGQARYVPTFNALWWIITTILVFGVIGWMQVLVTIIILLAP